MSAAGGRPLVAAVLFDAAGTLIELREAVGATYARFARGQGVEIPPARLDEAFGRILAQAPARVFPAASAAQVPALERAWWRDVVRGTFRAADQGQRFRDFDAFFDALFVHYGGADAWAARPGAREALVALRASGRRCAVVSNFDFRLPALLEALELAPYLDAVVLPPEAGAAKPDAAPFQCALARLSVSAARAVYVGDEPERDLAAARAAGLRTVDAKGLATLTGLIALVDVLEEESAHA